MSAADTRSIGQVLYEAMFPRGDTRTLWVNLRPIQREPYERAAEVIFKRGHDARGKEEKTLTPKAKQYRDALALLLAEAKHSVDCVDEEEKRDALRRSITKAEAVLR